MVGGEEVASPPAGVQPEPAPCRDDFPAPPPCLSSAQSAGPVLHRLPYPEVSAGRGHAIPTHGRDSELLHMESRWRFPYGGACAPRRRRGLWPHALLPPRPRCLPPLSSAPPPRVLGSPCFLPLPHADHPPQSGHLSLSKLGSNPVTLHIQLPSATPHPARTEPSPTRLSPPALTSCRPPRFGPGRSQCRC